ncbi:MAG: hypothetical protein ACYCRH_11045 [Acidiferrobacteraceae bacterium]
MEKKTKFMVLVGGCVLALSALASAAPARVTVAIHPEPGFYEHEHGTAVLESQKGGTEVIVHLAGVPMGASEPMHIHQGRCGHINPVPKWPLNPVTSSGVSKTFLKVPLAEIASGKYVINVHKSAKQLAVYVACGNINK